MSVLLCPVGLVRNTFLRFEPTVRSCYFTVRSSFHELGYILLDFNIYMSWNLILQIELTRALTNHIWPISPNIWPKSDYFLKQYLTKIWPKSGLFDNPEVNIKVLSLMRSFTSSINSMNWIAWFIRLSTGRKILCFTSNSNICTAARKCRVLA